MADINKYFPFLLTNEGGYVNDPIDKGGATNHGVTLSTWKQWGYDKNNDGVINKFDIMLLSNEDALKVLKRGYWDKWKADNINNQSVAEELVEWIWGSGLWGVKIPQRILGLKEDGVVGPITLATVNNTNQETFFYDVRVAKLKFIEDFISHHPEQERFRKGWISRILAITFKK